MQTIQGGMQTIQGGVQGGIQTLQGGIQIVQGGVQGGIQIVQGGVQGGIQIVQGGLQVGVRSVQAVVQGIVGRRSSLGLSDLANLRKNTIWSYSNTRRVGLQERLEELLVLELHMDGSKKYLNFTVRGLYKHVMTGINNKSSVRDRNDFKYKRSRSGRQNRGVSLDNTEALLSPLVLDALSDSEYQVESVGSRSEGSESSEPVHSPIGERNRLRQKQQMKAMPHCQRSPHVCHSPRRVQRKVELTSHRERIGGYLHPRDMRRLVTPLSASNEPAIIVRRNVILLNFDPLRAVVLRDRLLIIVPEGADSILQQLEKRVRGGIVDTGSCMSSSTHGSSDDEMAQSGHSQKEKKRRLRKQKSFDTLGKETDTASEADTTSMMGQYDSPDSGDEWTDLEGTEWLDLPYELQCTDAVLHTVSAFLSQDTIALQEASTDYIRRILKDKTGAQDDPLTIIRAVKEAVREMTRRVKGFAQSMNRILDVDEDMALMNLSRFQTHPERFMHPVSPEVLEEESDEPELILESYLQEGMSLINVLDTIQGQIESAAELVEQRLDSVRNRILMANLVLTAMSVAISVGSLVGSLFGMNVPIPYEEDDRAFLIIVLGAVAGSVFICFAIMSFLRYSGTVPQLGLSAE